MWGGETLAEKNQSNQWTDYIYADSKKIAKVVSQVRVLSLQGLRTSANASCGVQGAVNGVPVGLAGLVTA